MSATERYVNELRRQQRFGWVRDLPDVRDRLFEANEQLLKPLILPSAINLQPHMPPVYDQGDLGSCTANAVAALIEYDQIIQHEPDLFVPSRLFIYYFERKMEGTLNSDAGAMLRDGIKVVNGLGAPPETLWPYDIHKFTFHPSQEAMDAARLGKALSYKRIPQSLYQMRGCLAAGYPFSIGFSIYDNMMTPEVAASGVVPMPQGDLLGGHAVAIVGYDDHRSAFVFRNSWGVEWGAHGYGTLPYAYVRNPGLAGDFWTIRRVA